MKEIPCLFGHDQCLAGIITEPVLSEGKLQVPEKAVILISAGLLPMSGPFRFYTNLARRLALEKILTLRFDLGGIGESRSIQASRPLSERTAQEISTAINYLMEQYPSIKHLTLGGLCSGAEDAFRASCNDSRITGVILIDPFAYRTQGWGWRNSIYRFTRRLMRSTGFYNPVPLRSSCASLEGRRVVTYQYMAYEESSQVLKTLLDRNASVHFIYTSSMREYFNHRNQLAKMFPGIPFRGLVKLDLFLTLDHTQVLENEQRMLIEAIIAGQR